jgi:hypothetical protein
MAKIIPHCLLVATMTVSRRLVSMGRKLCLFVYYVELTNNKQWMVEEATTLNGAMESRMVEGSIRRKIQEQCM